MAHRQIVEIDEAKCDGCGRCVPACAEGAIRIVDGKAKLVADVYCDGLGACLGECPRGAITIVQREAEPFDERKAQLNVLPASGIPQQPSAKPARSAEASALANWPIQLHLVPADAPFLRDADLFLVADCVPFACAEFHSRVLRRRPLVIGCPKLDNGRAYVDKLAEMLVRSTIKSLTVVHMEVPCCTNLVRIAGEAQRLAGSTIPLQEITISTGRPR
jgi:Pyruvate/2-oxoacid:ferredoxin oxidoreductase delta subunit